MKKKLSLLLALVMLVSCVCASGAAAADTRPGPVIRVNGTVVAFPDGQPYYDEHGRTMVPVRFVSEQLGAEVSWINETMTAVIERNGVRVEIPIGKTGLTVTENGKTRTIRMDTAAVLKDGRTCVPVRFVAEALGAYVDFSETTQTVGIWSEVLTADEIAMLRSLPYTQPKGAVGYETAKKVYDAETLAFYYGTDRASFPNFANAREHLYHTVERNGTYVFPDLGVTLKDGGADTFYRKTVEEAVRELAYESKRLTVEFLADTSCVYQADNMDGLTCAVRGIARVTIRGKVTGLTGSETALLCRLGFTKLSPDSVQCIPADVHMNTQSGYLVDVQCIVPAGEAF